MSSTTPSEKTIGRTRTVEGGVEKSANRRRKSRAIVGGAQYVFVWELVELSKSCRVPHGNRR